jgi:hypothetical protein
VAGLPRRFYETPSFASPPHDGFALGSAPLSASFGSTAASVQPAGLTWTRVGPGVPRHCVQDGPEQLKALALQTI